MTDSTFFEVLEELFEAIGTEEFFDLLGTLFQGSAVAIPLLIWGVLVIGMLLILLVFHFVSAYPVYVLGKKAGCTYAWIAWIPVMGHALQTCVLCDMARNREFYLFGNLRMQDRKKSLMLYIAMGVILPLLVLPLAFIPYLGTFALVILSPIVTLATYAAYLMEYGYLRDALDRFCEDRKNNVTAAILIVVLDLLATGGLARTVWLYTLLKKDILPEEPAEAVAAV